MTKEGFLEFLESGEVDEDALFFGSHDNPEYYNALLGVSDGNLVYPYKGIVEFLMERDGMTDEEAIEFTDYNVVGAYMGPKTPMVVYDMYLEEIYG